MFNLHMILSDTVKMKEYQEVYVMILTRCFCCCGINVQLYNVLFDTLELFFNIFMLSGLI